MAYQGINTVNFWDRSLWNVWVFQVLQAAINLSLIQATSSCIDVGFYIGLKLWWLKLSIYVNDLLQSPIWTSSLSLASPLMSWPTMMIIRTASQTVGECIQSLQNLVHLEELHSLNFINYLPLKLHENWKRSIKMHIPNSVFSRVILSILTFSWGRYNVPATGRPAPLQGTPGLAEVLSEKQSEKPP